MRGMHSQSQVSAVRCRQENLFSQRRAPLQAHDGSMLGQIRSWFSALPLVTKTVLSVCLGGYLSFLLLGLPLSALCFTGARIFYPSEIIRGFLSVFFHIGRCCIALQLLLTLRLYDPHVTLAGLLHLLLNMLVFVPACSHLERYLGSLMTANLFVVLAALGALLHSILALTAEILFPRERSAAVPGPDPPRYRPGRHVHECALQVSMMAARWGSRGSSLASSWSRTTCP